MKAEIYYFDAIAKNKDNEVQYHLCLNFCK